MRSNILLAVLLCAAASFAADKNKLPLEQTSNELTEISATVFIDKDQIHQELGADPGSDIVLVKVQVRAVSSKPVSISHDDFVLFSEKDGQRSEPFEPGQIAGSATLVVTPGGARGGGVANQRKGPSFGGGMGGARIGGAALVLQKPPNPRWKVPIAAPRTVLYWLFLRRKSCRKRILRTPCRAICISRLRAK